MNSNIYKEIVSRAFPSFAYHKIIRDNNGKAVDYEFVDINQAYEKYTGFAAKEIIGKRASSLFTDKSADKLKQIEMLGSLSEKGGTTEFEDYCHRLDKWFRIEVSSFEKDYFSTIATDITEQKKLIRSNEKYEELSHILQESEERFKKLSMLTFEGIIIHNKGIAIDANDSLLKMIGYSREELIGMNVIQTVIASECHHTVAENITKGYAKPYEISAIRKDGSRFHAEVVARDIHYKDEMFRVAAVRDITDRVRDREELMEKTELLEQFFLVNLDLLCIANNKGEFVKLNQEWENTLGYPLEELEGKAFLDYVHPDDVEATKHEMANLSNQIKTINFVNRYRCRDGSYRYIEWRSHPKGELFYAAARDITDHIKTEEEILSLNEELQATSDALRENVVELEKAKHKAEENDRLKTEFLANMSHEIRTPMNAIVGFASFLKERSKTRKDIDRYADIITTSGNHLLAIINDIIDISKINAGKVSVASDPVDISQIMKEQYTFFKSELQNKKKEKIKLILKEPEEEVCCFTDETRLRQILINLLGNAVKFTGEGHIEFGYEVKDQEVVFHISDTGIGITPEQQKHIFEPFRQVADNTERLYGGTGLGLAIAKACSELLGGKLSVQSVYGKGTTFFFSINYKTCQTNKQPTTMKQINDISFNGEHLLIAEDDDINFQYLQEVFQPYNLRISRTINGTETVEVVDKATDIDLILMDIQMPQLDGLSATKIIREKNTRVPIIAQTAYAFASDRIKSMNAGCNDYLSKPTKPGELISIVYKYLSEKHAT